jgi:hypothetical protein
VPQFSDTQVRRSFRGGGITRDTSSTIGMGSSARAGDASTTVATSAKMAAAHRRDTIALSVSRQRIA